jgi:hypothetical protein
MILNLFYSTFNIERYYRKTVFPLQNGMIAPGVRPFVTEKFPNKNKGKGFEWEV